MRVDFFSCWKENSMKPGGAFPISFLEIFADIHPSYRFMEIRILNFGISLDFRKEIESPEQGLWSAIQESRDGKK